MKNRNKVKIAHIIMQWLCCHVFLKKQQLFFMMATELNIEVFYLFTQVVIAKNARLLQLPGARNGK